MPPQDVNATGLSGLLTALELAGHCWCYGDLGEGGGFSVPGSDAVLFHAVLHGTVRLTAPGGGTIELKAGEAVCLLSGEAHALRVTPDADASVHAFLREGCQSDIPPGFAFGQPGTLAARVLSGRMIASLPGGANRAGLPTFYRLGSDTLLRPDALAQAGIGPGSSALLTRLAALMLTARLRADPRCAELFAPRRQDPIAQALRLVAGNPSAHWTVERLARSVGMGRSSFAAHFTAEVGRAPMEVVAEARMEHAAELLRRGNLKIAEIAELSGYGSEAAFCRRFSRHFGQSPGSLREASRAAGPSDPVPAWSPLLGRPRLPETAALLRQRVRLPVAEHGPSASPTLLRGRRS
ncbi:MAG: helix-turn-helix transcriptional regulator [Sphingomonadales bacterium]|nr:helix-turn-helix transcriptional regulator [Sphingomonadales bacterium]